MARVARVIDGIALRQRLRWVGRLPAARTYLEDQLRRDLSKPGTESNRSSPGEHPYKQTGRGRESVVVSIDLLRLALSVKANAYMAWHNANGRPWFNLTWKRVAPQVRRIMTGKR